MQLEVNMKNKPAHKRKTFWGGLAAVLTGVGLIVNGEPAAGVQTIATGVLAIFLRDGMAY